MQRVNQLLTILILIIFASAGWFLIVQTILVRQGVIPPGGRTPDFRRVGALAELEPVPTPPPLLDIDPERTDRSDGGDTIALKLTTNIPLGHQFAGGEVFTVRILATPKYRGQLNNMLHLEGIRFPIRYNKDFLQLKVLPVGSGVKLDDTDLSEECSLYELAEPSVFIMGNIDSFNSFYFHKKFPRSDPRYGDPNKGIQLQPNTCIGEVKFQVIRKEQIDPALLTSMFIDAQVMIPNVAREIGVDGRGPEGTFPDGTLIGNIDLNEHLEWRISNGQVVGTFALGHHLKAPQGVNPTSNVPTSTTAPGVPTNTRVPTPTSGGGGGPTPTSGSTPTPIGGGEPTPTPNPTMMTYDKEAESYSQLVAPMVTVTDDVVSNCVYLTDPIGWSQGGGGTARYDFNITRTDIYWIWARVKGTGWNNNSFFVRVDDGVDIHMEIEQTGGQWDWHWQPVMESSAVYLTAGEHAIRFIGRETNSGVDRIALVNRPPSQYTPNQFTTCGSSTPTPTTPGTGATNTPTTTPKPTITPQAFSDCENVTGMPVSECIALEDLYINTVGAEWSQRYGWLQTDRPCGWFGVTCNNSGNVVTLDLDQNNLKGQLPSSLGNLIYLVELSLSNNKLSGTIPTSIGNLGSSLTTLLIDGIGDQYNNLQGYIPQEFSNLTHVRTLKVGGNLFENVASTDVCSVMQYAEQTPIPWWQLQFPPILSDPCPPPPTPTRPALQPVAATVEDTPTPTPYYIDLPPQNGQWPLLWLDREGEHIYTVPINYDKPQVDETYPDLTVVSMSLYSDPEVATCTIELETKIRNNGQTAALPFSVKANGQTYRVLTGLAPGREMTLRFSEYTHGTFMQPNIVRVDSESEVPELREDNNIMERYLFLGSILKPECQNITPPPAGTVTPGSITSIPLDMRKVNIRMKVKLQGIRQETFARQYARLRFGVAVGQTGGVNTEFTQSEFIHTGSGVYEGLVTFDPLVVPRGTNYKVIVKGPKHLSKRFCSAQASGDDYYCTENAGGIILNVGVQDFDFSTVPMAPGDLPFGGQQDGIVDSSDLTFIREHLPSKDAESLRVGDLNFDGIIDTQDFSLVINNLVNNEDER